MNTNYQKNRNMSGRRTGLDRRVFIDPDYNGIERRITKDRRKGTRERKHYRFRAKDLTFVKLHSEFEEDIGQLLDISKGGLSFRFFEKEEKSRRYSGLGIFVSGDDFTVAGIPFRTVSEIEMGNTSPFSTVVFRRYGIQFEKLTSDQMEKLNYFFLNHTFGAG